MFDVQDVWSKLFNVYAEFYFKCQLWETWREDGCKRKTFVVYFDQ